MEANNNYDTSANKATEVNLKDTLLSYLYYWKWFVLSLAVCLILGFAYIEITTPLYQIETDLLIKQDQSNPGQGSSDDILKSLDLFTSDKIIDNEVQILKSYTLMEKVVNDLGLKATYYVNGKVRKYALYGNLPFQAELLKPNDDSYKHYLKVTILNDKEGELDGKRFLLNQPVQSALGLVLISANHVDANYLNTEIDVKFTNLPDFYIDYSKLLSINPVSKEGTVLIITYQDAVPKRGEDILNKLVYEYNNAAVDDKNKVTASTLSFIEDRLKKLADELGTAEKNVQSYKSDNNITDITAQSQAFMQTLQQNDADLSKVNIQLSVLENLEKYIHDEKDEQEKLPSMLGIDDPTLLGLVSQLGETQLKKESLLQTIPETNPIVHSINDQITSLKNAINQSVQNLKSGLTVTQQQLQNKNGQFESIIKQVPLKERGLLDVMRQQDIKNALFNFLLQKREEQEMSLASNLADSRTVDVARSTPLPVKPVKPLIMMIFFLLGLMIPTVVIYLRGILNDKVSRRSDINKLTNAPILGEIAHSDESSPLIVVQSSRSMVSEQIRSLRTNLQFVSADKDHKVLLFTSAVSGEGKSFISLNLGASLAMSGKKVIILELDMRRPKLHVALDINNDRGLSNYLISNIDYREILKDVPNVEGYHIITCGLTPPNPAELMTNGRLEKLIAQLQQDFDFVLIDAPPIGLVTDAQIMAKFADATLFIVRHKYTLKTHLQLIEDFYKYNKFPNLNIVFNAIDYSSGNYGYGYGYTSNGYYQEEARKRSWFGKLLKSK